VNVVMNILVLQNAGKFLSGCTSGGLSSSAQLHRVNYLPDLLQNLVEYVGTSHMSVIRHMCVAMQRLVDFISMVTQ
jgi:hypothetical protein